MGVAVVVGAARRFGNEAATAPAPINVLLRREVPETRIVPVVVRVVELAPALRSPLQPIHLDRG